MACYRRISRLRPLAPLVADACSNRVGALFAGRSAMCCPVGEPPHYGRHRAALTALRLYSKTVLVAQVLRARANAWRAAGVRCAGRGGGALKRSAAERCACVRPCAAGERAGITRSG